MAPDARSGDYYPCLSRSHSVTEQALEQKPRAASFDVPISPSDADTVNFDDEGSRSSSICSSSIPVDESLVGRLKRPSSVATSSSSGASNRPTRCATRSPPSPRVDIRLKRRIGAGTFGTVYQGEMDGANVAVK